MAKEYKDLIVGLDIGTAKVMVVVAEVLPGGELRVAGLGVASTHGLKRGVVVNIDATVQSIQQALKEAEMMAACKIGSVWTGITGSHIRGQNSTGMVIVRDNREVTPVDVARVVETAKAINIPNDQRLLLVEPQEFVIDGHEVKEPIGMSGSRLEVKVHIVTGAQSAAENILKCVRRCGLEVQGLVLNPSASAAAVLTEDEKDLGVAVVDIGAGTTDVQIYTDGSVRHTAVIPIAGDLITSDIAMALRTPTKDAEEIKVEHGVAKQMLADPGEQLEVPGLGDRAPRILSPAGPGRRDRAARRGDLLAGAPGHPRQRLRGTAVQRHRAHRRYGGDARHGRAGRGHLPQTGAQGPADLPRAAVRHGRQPAYGHRDGPARGGARGACARAQGGGAGGVGQDPGRPRQGLVSGQFLKGRTNAARLRSTTPRRRQSHPLATARLKARRSTWPSK